MTFDKLSMVNCVGSMKTWGKLSCTLCMKERIDIIDNLQRRYTHNINNCSKVYIACCHIPRLQRFTQTDDSLMGENIANFKFFKSTKKKNHFQIVDHNLEKEKITTLERVLLV